MTHKTVSSLWAKHKGSLPSSDLLIINKKIKKSEFIIAEINDQKYSKRDHSHNT
jgi:hypothetical protein